MSPKQVRLQEKSPALQRARELFKHDISKFYPFLETISTCLDPNLDPDPPNQLNLDLIESETLF